MRARALTLIWLGLLVDLPAIVCADATGRHWLFCVASGASAVTFTGWVLLARTNRRGGER